MNEQTVFMARLRALRKENGWTQADLAKKLDIGRSTVAEYESGKITPGGTRLLEICRVFGVSAEYLTGDDVMPQADAPDALDAVNRIIAALDLESGLTFDGKPITSETRALLKASLANSLALSRLTQKENK